MPFIWMFDMNQPPKHTSLSADHHGNDIPNEKQNNADIVGLKGFGTRQRLHASVGHGGGTGSSPERTGLLLTAWCQIAEDLFRGLVESIP